MESNRSPQDVFHDHLQQRRHHAQKDELLRNYAEDVVVLTKFGVFRGHEGIHQLAERLRKEMPTADFHFKTAMVEGEIGLLEWTAQSPGSRVEDGVDSFVIRNGRIVAQTTHYTVKKF